MRFGRFRLDLGQRTLSDQAAPVRLGSRALDILCVLASAKGGVVTKADLMARVWPGLVVSDNSLQVHVSALRKVLDPDGTGQSHVVTVQGRGYQLIGITPQPSATEARASDWLRLSLPARPSIAVLPFDSMSGKPQDQYFSDGVVEDIITALSRFSGLFVTARNSSFTYRGRAVDMKQIGRELGVRYLLEGSVRRVGTRIRVTGQLIEAETAMHLWADRFEGELEDVFAVQDHVTASVVGAIAPRLEEAEINRAKRKTTESLDAYDYFLRGKAFYDEWTIEANGKALDLFHKAIELDPAFSSAYGLAAHCYSQRKAGGWASYRTEDRAAAEDTARRAVELGRDDEIALCEGGYTLAHVVGDLRGGLFFIDRSLMLNPNLAQAWYFAAYVRAWLGEAEQAIEYAMRAIRLSPVDKRMFGMQNCIAHAHFVAGRYEDASLWSEKTLRAKPDYGGGLRIFAASSALVGRLDEARQAVARLRKIDPRLRLANLGDTVPFRPVDLARFSEGMRKAGLPE